MTVEKLPPQNVEMERAVLGSVLIDPDALLFLHGLMEPEDFYRDTHGVIWRAMRDLFRARQPVDFATLCDELERRGELAEVGGAAYLTALINAVPTSIHAEHYAGIVLRHSRLRQLLRAAGEIAGLAYSDGDLQDVLDEARRIVSAISPLVDRRSGARLEDTLLEYMTLLVRRAAEDPASRLVLPWAALKPFVPPLAPGTMIGIIANPGVGKTAFIECCLEKWARLGKRCALFHYELSLPVMLDRRMQRHSAIPIARLRCGIADGSPEWQLVSEVTDRISKWPGEIIYVHCPRWSAAQVAAEATRLHDEQRLDVIALDYLNKIPVPHANGFNFAQRRGQDIEEFKTVCEQLGVVGLLAAQFDKASKTSRDPTQYGLAGARDTGELLDKSNVGLALGRPCPEYDDENVTKVVVDKVNDGRTGTAFMYFRGDRLSFTDLHPEGE